MKEEKNRLRDIIRKKIMPAIKASEGEFVDSVRVRIAGNKEYLQEVATGKMRRGNAAEYNMLKMTEEELNNCELSVRSGTFFYKNNPFKKASTAGITSKGEENLQAFVMAKDGSFYTATHTGKWVSGENISNLSHASFLGGRPAELAGMVSISNGKITKITTNSGHYKPDELDMYRGIKKLDNRIFSPDCKVLIRGEESSLSEFINKMESIQASGKMLHEEKREERKSKTKETILSFSELERHIDENINADTGNDLLIEAFQECLERNDNKSMKHFIAKLKETGKLEEFLKIELDSTKATPLHFVAAEGTVEMAIMLLDNGANLEASDAEGRTALHEASNLKMTQCLLNRGANIEAVNTDGKTFLEESVETYDSLLSSNKYGSFYLEIENFERIIVGLIDKGANTENVKDNPLIKKITEEYTKVFNFVCDSGSNKKYNDKITKDLDSMSKIQQEMILKKRDKQGNTLLHVAARDGNLELCKLLINKGADVASKNNEGKQPVILAQEKPKRTIGQYFRNFFSDTKYPSAKELNEVSKLLSEATTPTIKIAPPSNRSNARSNISPPKTPFLKQIKNSFNRRV